MDWRIFKVLLMLTVKCTDPVLINSTDKKLLEKAVGGSAILECQFTLAPDDIGPLEIEWTRLSGLQEDPVIIVFSAGQIYDNYYVPLKDRVHFISTDPRKGDASVKLLRLRPSDSGTYKCQVKKVPGIQRIAVILRVMHAPSNPSCHTKGTAEVGGNVVLHCNAQEGAIPIDYNWQRATGPYTLPSSAHLDAVAGRLHIPRAKENDSGTYHCIARNRVGIAECFLELRIIPPPSMVGMISGAVVSILLVLAVVIFIVFRCCKCKMDTVEANDIREDASPPKHRKLAMTGNVTRSTTDL
ncbi:coxsackievirus and adenovirus receptor homolog [Alosa sapidissima]|uniref:coxsackievirus and adenovirus receptor homolog n=1 Tax=Alosa sapidissima TaxID=34773 RepID=UPI001C0A186E|nr:coxsackievirus and adenovirus receptor homolog [Alosa sapidissima]